eukprot:CAMPEP_0194367370 /NCGR_PEP_ID=MMETSP0174-20130528/15434_1 /TAXON_ID=216777 /ORGANISM="Proboscia alata, Strain PI-D3" /LENGTH=867 /DNA_ID=CAMNT_0039143053 /DNA_START=231 /DNA_END=2834 /DNA_ORIENTATION=+
MTFSESAAKRAREARKRDAELTISRGKTPPLPPTQSPPKRSHHQNSSRTREIAIRDARLRELAELRTRKLTKLIHGKFNTLVERNAAMKAAENAVFEQLQQQAIDREQKEQERGTSFSGANAHNLNEQHAIEQKKIGDGERRRAKEALEGNHRYSAKHTDTPYDKNSSTPKSKKKLSEDMTVAASSAAPITLEGIQEGIQQESNAVVQRRKDYESNNEFNKSSNIEYEKDTTPKSKTAARAEKAQSELPQHDEPKTAQKEASQAKTPQKQTRRKVGGGLERSQSPFRRETNDGTSNMIDMGDADDVSVASSITMDIQSQYHTSNHTRERRYSESGSKSGSEPSEGAFSTVERQKCAIQAAEQLARSMVLEMELLLQASEEEDGEFSRVQVQSRDLCSATDEFERQAQIMKMQAENANRIVEEASVGSYDGRSRSSVGKYSAYNNVPKGKQRWYAYWSDEHHREYYYEPKTGNVVWTMPEDFDAAVSTTADSTMKSMEDGYSEVGGSKSTRSQYNRAQKKNHMSSSSSVVSYDEEWDVVSRQNTVASRMTSGSRMTNTSKRSSLSTPKRKKETSSLMGPILFVVLLAGIVAFTMLQSDTPQHIPEYGADLKSKGNSAHFEQLEIEEQEAIRRKAEASAQKRREEEEARSKEEDIKLKNVDSERKRVAAEEKRLAAEKRAADKARQVEKKRLLAEKKATEKREAEEAARLLAEKKAAEKAAAKYKAEQEALLAEYAKKAKSEEEKRIFEEAKKKAEEEARSLARKEAEVKLEKQRKIDEEKHRLAAEETIKQQKLDEEKERLAEEEASKQKAKEEAAEKKKYQVEPFKESKKKKKKRCFIPLGWMVMKGCREDDNPLFDLQALSDAMLE